MIFRFSNPAGNPFQRIISMPQLWLAVMMGGYVVWALLVGPDTNCDLRNYHIYNGLAFLQGGHDHNIFPSQLQAWNNPVFNAFVTLLIYHLPPMAVAVTLAVVQSLNIPLLFLLVRQVLTSECESLSPRMAKMLALAVVAVGVTGAMTLSEIGTTFGDNVTSLAVLSGLLLLGRGFEQKQNRLITYSAAGFCLGIACGFKLTNVIFIPGAALALLLIPGTFSRRLVGIAVLGAGMLAGWALLDGWWAWDMWRQTGNPIFPQMNQIFHSPWFDAVDIADHRFRPRSFSAAIEFPFLTAIGDHPGAEAFFSDMRFALITLLVPVLAFRRPKGLAAALMVFFIVSFLVWMFLFGIERYAIPLEMLSGIMLVLLVGRVLPKAALAPVTIGLALFLMATTTAADWWHLGSWDAVGRNGNWFNVSVPPELDRPNEIFLLLDEDRASAYIIPWFRKDARFVRMQGSIDPSPATLLYKQRAAAIADHQGAFYAISIHRPDAQQVALMSTYGLAYTEGGCLTLTANIESLFVCPLQRIKG